ncbi:MAG: hypothetical protein H7Z16_17590 [Pyrinomonadaceae bacterium]|nr:hypothetical protein [Pyrinomonadaceae bacterium]
MNYYDSDDVSDKAATQFKLILSRHRTSAEAESAQYHLARYYQRKFYIIKRNQGREDRLSLSKARTEYGNYTKKYFKQGAKWLSDAFFNLALVYFQLNDSQKGGWELNKMRKYAGMDPYVHIDEVVWSPDSDDVINADYPAEALADFVKGNSEKPFPYLIEAIKRWCRALRTR